MHLVMVKRRKRRSVPKDKKSRVPKKYLSGATGARRTELASIIKRSDRFRHGDLDCSNAIGGGTNLEFGVVGLLDQQPFETIGQQNNFLGDYQRDVGVYARITIPLDKPKERINCNTLYKLALERERLEVQRLKAEVANLRKLQFENDGE